MDRPWSNKILNRKEKFNTYDFVGLLVFRNHLFQFVYMLV